MHRSAMLHARMFFETYLAGRPPGTIVEIGSQIIDGSLRQVAPPAWDYGGTDFVAEPGVDVMLDDPCSLLCASLIASAEFCRGWGDNA